MKTINTLSTPLIIAALTILSIPSISHASTRIAQNTTVTSQTQNTKTKSSNTAPEIDYATLGELDKQKLLSVIKCLTTKGVNTDTAISSCLPLVTKAPQNPLKKDISAVPTVKVIYPNGGEKLTEGTTIRIKYIASSSNSVDIKLWNSATPTIDLATNLPPEGFYEWKVKANAGYNTDYAIGVRAKNANGSTYDISDTYVKIQKAPATSTTGATEDITTSKTGFLSSQQAASAQRIIEKVRGLFNAFTK